MKPGKLLLIKYLSLAVPLIFLSSGCSNAARLNSTEMSAGSGLQAPSLDGQISRVSENAKWASILPFAELLVRKTAGSGKTAASTSNSSSMAVGTPIQFMDSHSAIVADSTIIVDFLNPDAGDEGNFVVMGSVTNGSGGPLGEITEVRLIMVDGNNKEQFIIGLLSTDGTFRFGNVPYHADWSYWLQMDHNGVAYSSKHIYGRNFHANQAVDLSFTVYDATTDLSLLDVERQHILLNFQSNGMIHVVESYLIVNSSSYTAVPMDINSPLISFKLNKEARNITYQDLSDQQYIRVIDNTLEDSQPILPGSVHQVLFQYDLPFSGERTLEFSSPVKVSSAIVMVQDPKNQTKCSGMMRFEKNPVGTSTIMLFSDVNVDPGEKLALSCFNTKEAVPIAIGIFSIGCILLAVILVLNNSHKKVERKRLFSDRKVKKVTILDAIIALDDQLKAGEISTEVYRIKREELIRRLEGE
jgi:hypothetical protein